MMRIIKIYIYIKKKIYFFKQFIVNVKSMNTSFFIDKAVNFKRSNKLKEINGKGKKRIGKFLERIFFKKASPRQYNKISLKSKNNQ